MAEEVAVAEFVGVGVDVRVVVGVKVLVALAVGVAVTVLAGTGVRVLVAVKVGVRVAVGVAVAVTVAVRVEVAVAVLVLVEVGVAVGEALHPNSSTAAPGGLEVQESTRSGTPSLSESATKTPGKLGYIPREFESPPPSVVRKRFLEVLAVLSGFGASAKPSLLSIRGPYHIEKTGSALMAPAPAGVRPII